jgi:hypothetical protein
MKRSTMVLAAAAALFLAGAARAQDFSLGLEGCPDRLTGNAGDVVTFDVFATLTTANNPDTDGPQGWSLSVTADGGAITAITVKGVHVSTIFDDDGDPATPLINPSDLDLNSAGFKVNQLAQDPNNPAIKGAVSAIVLHQTQKQVLQPNGTARIAKLTVQGTIPQGDQCVSLTLRYLNGLKGAGQPVNNVVTFKGNSKAPALGSCTVQLCPRVAGFDFALAGAGKGFDNNTVDVAVNVPQGATSADVSIPVDALLRSHDLAPGSDGPQGWSISVAHEACMSVDSVSVKGVHVSTIFDDDGDPATPVVDPSDLDLNNAGFKVTQKAVGVPPLDPALQGVVSAIVLHQTQKMVLHANATDTILRINYTGTFPLGTTTCHASFIDGLKGAGQPVANVITVNGNSKKPGETRGLTINVTVKVVQKDNFVRGDPNNDGKEDIGDAIYIVYHVVPSLNNGQYPLACSDAGDADSSGMVDLADAIFLINHQFRAGPAPGGPYPACGTTDASTSQSCPAGSTNCP